MIRTTLILAFALGTAICQARAADIKVMRDKDGTTLLLLEGQIEENDGSRFAMAASGIDHGIVVFASPGGSLLAGLRIGQFIRLHEFRTLVPDGARCASACALAWLGGTRRFMQPNGLVGFHAAYIRDASGRARETGAGNALVGAYLSRLGLDDEAIVYIEKAAPDDITWLRESDAKRLGIQVSILPSFQEDPPPAPHSPPPVKPRAELTQLAASFAGAYFAHWSETNRDALGYFRTIYFPRVTFYGQAVPSAIVLDQKAKFAERWPERLYAVRADTVRAACAAGGCDVTGIVDWDARNASHNQRSAGSANFFLKLAFQGDAPLIMQESGSVISRENSDVPADTAVKKGAPDNATASK